jgi:hypothetical protein
MRPPNLTLCAAALLSSLACGQIVGKAFAATAADSDSRRLIPPGDRNGGSVVNLGGRYLESGVRDVFDISDVGPQPGGIDAELNGEDPQTFAQLEDWDDWMERQVVTLTGVDQAADSGPEQSKWAIVLIGFAGLTAALSGRRRARRAVITA